MVADIREKVTLVFYIFEIQLKLHLHWAKAKAKANFFFDLCPCSKSPLKWILYEPIWKQCRLRFRYNLNEPLPLAQGFLPLL